MNNITIMNNTAMMSTLQIAELTDKLHKNVLRDVRDLIETLKGDAIKAGKKSPPFR